MTQAKNLLPAALAALVCCASPEVARVRFVNQPPVVAVNDRQPVPKKPHQREVFEYLEQYDGLVHRPVVGATKLRRPRSAQAVNSLGEVPDSTWFTNRPPPSVEDVRRGPTQGPGPMAHKPWTILSSKSSGVAPGFVIQDSAGDRYVLKFDIRGHPETESGADIILDRLLWALGYNVPEDYLIWVSPNDLVRPESAKVIDDFGAKHPMTVRFVREVLAKSAIRPDGVLRGVASKLVPGIPIGPFSESGVRKDDPNDLVPHQHRRDLRGLQPICAWLKHTDIKEGNTLDTWVTDPQTGERYVRHYLIDFGKALGIIARVSFWRSDGYARWIDGGETAASLFSLGLYRRPWDGIDAPDYVGLGIIRADRYDPGTFDTRLQFRPFAEARPADEYWGAKQMMRLGPEHIRAAVEAARYSDPRTTEYLTRVLVARHRKTVLYWFRRVNPLDDFAVESHGGDDELCFHDLPALYRLEPPQVLKETRYGASTYGYDGRPTGWQAQLFLTREDRVCMADLEAAPSRGGYTIVSIATARPGSKYGPVEVHLAPDPRTGRLRVIGVWR